MTRFVCLALTLMISFAPLAKADDWQSVLDQAQTDLKEGKADEAEEGFRKAEKMLEAAKATDKDELKKFGFSVVDCLVGISKCKEKKGDPSQAESIYEMGLETLKKFCENGWRNPQYADYLPGIVELYDRHGKTAEAEGALKRLEDIRTTVPPKDQAKLMACYELYSSFLRSHRRPEEATQYETKISQMKYNMQN